MGERWAGERERKRDERGMTDPWQRWVRDACEVAQRWVRDAGGKIDKGVQGEGDMNTRFMRDAWEIHSSWIRGGLDVGDTQSFITSLFLMHASFIAHSSFFHLLVLIRTHLNRLWVISHSPLAHHAPISYSCLLNLSLTSLPPQYLLVTSAACLIHFSLIPHSSHHFLIHLSFISHSPLSNSSFVCH